MEKLIKLCAVMMLFLVGTPWEVYAQSDDSAPIVVNDLLGENRFIEKKKNLMKISLIDSSDGTVHKVLYYLTPNTYDVSLSQIKEELASQNIKLDMTDMSVVEVDSEVKEYKTNLGVFTKQLISINIPLMNPNDVPVVGESGSELLNVTELPVLSAIMDGEVIVSISFKDDNGNKLYTEHFLTYYDNHTDLLKIASDKFKEQFPNYVYDLDNVYLSKNVSGDPEIIMTNLGEIKAFTMEMTVPVQLEIKSSEASSNDVVSDVEEKSTQPEKSSTEASGSVEEKSIQPEKSSTEANSSVKEKSTQSLKDDEQSNKQKQVTSAVEESKPTEASSTVKKEIKPTLKPQLPTTGELGLSLPIIGAILVVCSITLVVFVKRNKE